MKKQTMVLALLVSLILPSNAFGLDGDKAMYQGGSVREKFFPGEIHRASQTGTYRIRSYSTFSPQACQQSNPYTMGAMHWVICWLQEVFHFLQRGINPEYVQTAQVVLSSEHLAVRSR